VSVYCCPPVPVTTTCNESDPTSEPSFAASASTYVPVALNVTFVEGECGEEKLAVPGPDTRLQSRVTLPGFKGMPSSATVAARDRDCARGTVRFGPTSTQGARLWKGGFPYHGSRTKLNGFVPFIPTVTSTGASAPPLRTMTRHMLDSGQG
jgi:hypothetical protein